MTQYLFTYRSVPGYDWFGDPTGLRDWQTFLEAIERNMVDPGMAELRADVTYRRDRAHDAGRRLLGRDGRQPRRGCRFGQRRPDGHPWRRS